MEAYSLNPKILPSDPINKQEHKNRTNVALAAALIAVVFGVVFWMVASRTTEEIPIDSAESIREQILSIISATPDRQFTEEEVDRIAEKISAPSTFKPTDEQRSAILEKISGTNI